MPPQPMEDDGARKRPLAEIPCPYCGRPLKWCDYQWAGHGVFECGRCGEFPDFTINGEVEKGLRGERAGG